MASVEKIRLFAKQWNAIILWVESSCFLGLALCVERGKTLWGAIKKLPWIFSKRAGHQGNFPDFKRASEQLPKVSRGTKALL